MRGSDWALAISLAYAFIVGACDRGGPARGPDALQGSGGRDTGTRRPRLEIVARSGDAQAGLALAVSTANIGADREALVGVALAALVEARLQAAGVDARATGGSDGYRVRLLVANGAAPRLAGAIRSALLSPVLSAEPALAFVTQRWAEIATHPLANTALADVARCTGEAFALGTMPAPAADELETWRAAANGLGRIAIALAGETEVANAMTDAIAAGPPWPAAAPLALQFPSKGADDLGVYDATGDQAAGTAHIVLAAWTERPDRAVAGAALLSDVRGPLASRLSALEEPAHLAFVSATVHRDGGCLVVAVDLGAQGSALRAAESIATAAALARQEIAVELADVTPEPDLGRALALRAPDPRDAAEREAWWALSTAGDAPLGNETRVRLAVGLAPGRDSTPESVAALADPLRRAVDRATLAWHARQVEPRTRAEPGQGEVWVLVGSPCGTLTEGPADAGIGAAVAFAAAMRASRQALDADVEPVVAADAIGVLVHGPSHAGEAPDAHARRIADLAARAFAADPLESEDAAQARAQLLLVATRTGGRALETLASALAPAHPAWVIPTGTSLGLASISDAALALHAAVIRHGPLRVAVVANTDLAQAGAGVRAVDRWIARGPQEARACPPFASGDLPRSGTYAAVRSGGALSEVLVAAPLDGRVDSAAARWLAAALGGAEGPVGLALEAPGDPSQSSAELLDIRCIGEGSARAIVVRIAGPDAALDAAVARVREVFARVRQAGPAPGDVARAAFAVHAEDLAAGLDPRARTIALWRGESSGPEPSPEALRALARGVLRDEALVIVAARPAPLPEPRARAHLPRGGQRPPQRP